MNGKESIQFPSFVHLSCSIGASPSEIFKALVILHTYRRRNEKYAIAIGTRTHNTYVEEAKTSSSVCITLRNCNFTDVSMSSRPQNAICIHISSSNWLETDWEEEPTIVQSGNPKSCKHIFTSNSSITTPDDCSYTLEWHPNRMGKSAIPTGRLRISVPAVLLRGFSLI